MPRRYDEADGGEDGGGGSGASVYDQFGVPTGSHGGEKFRDAEFFEIVALKTIVEIWKKLKKKKINQIEERSWIDEHEMELTDLIVSM